VAAQELFKFKLDMLSLAGSGGLGPDRGRAAEALTGRPLTPGRAAPGRGPHIMPLSSSTQPEARRPRPSL
jgi:hypothetical protein